YSFDGTASETITVNITGSNDNASIAFNGVQDTSVVEAGGAANATPGDPNASDVDDGEAVFQVPLSTAGTYGNFTFNAGNGNWSYALDNADGDTQALNAGDPASDSLVVYSFDGTASETITVNITGSNDNASIAFNGVQDTSVV